MSNEITPVNASPFDAIRRTDDAGNEYWSARDLQPLMGYARWENFETPLLRAIASAKNTGAYSDQAFSAITEKETGGRPKQNYHLSREAAYLVAMNGDPSKEPVAQAQNYFAVMTRKAEEPQDMLELMAASVAQMIAQRDINRAQQRINQTVDVRVTDVENSVADLAGSHGWFAALGYALKFGHATHRAYLAQVGKRASAIMRDRGDEPVKRDDATFGTINTYPSDVLKQAFGEVAN